MQTVFMIFFIAGVLAQLGTFAVVSSKFYAARYLTKDERESLDLQDQIRRFFGEFMFKDKEATKQKFLEFVEKDNKEKGIE